MDGLSVKEKIALSDVRFEKSKEMLSDAAKTFKDNMYKTSVNRSYYAVLHSARSLLILKGIDPVRHDSVKTMISLHFIKTNTLPRNVIKFFKNLLSLRTDVDYGDFDFVEKPDAENAIKQANNFIEIVEPVRQKMIDEMSSS